MQWSYHLGSTILATTSKFKIAVEIGVFRLIHEALYFCSICNNLDSVHRIQTKFGMDILLDPRNKPAKEFFHFFQNPRWPPAVKNFRRVILFQCFCNNFDPVNRIQTKFVYLLWNIILKYLSKIVQNGTILLFYNFFVKSVAFFQKLALCTLFLACFWACWWNSRK